MSKNKLNAPVLIPLGIKRKLRIAVALMAILPFLVSLYLVSNYVLPRVGIKLDIAVSIIVSVFIGVIGFFVIKEVFDRVMSVASEAKLIAAGDLNRRLEMTHTDEVSDLSEALNQLTERIRNNMNELKSYGEKTTEINIEIQKRVIMFSSLLQVSSLISQGVKLHDILKLIVEKSCLLANSDTAYLLFRQEEQESFHVTVADGINAGRLMEIYIQPQDGLFKKAIEANKPLILDKENALPHNLTADFYEKFKLKNTLAFPVYLKGRITAILGIGNTKESFSYGKEDVELMDILAKQIAIAIENDVLLRQVEKLEVKDALTGLYNEAYIHNRLQEEIKRAIMCRRPCGFIVFDVDNLKTFYQNFGSLQTEATLKKVASLIRESVSEIDRVGRTGDDEFSLILPEKNKRQAQRIAEEIRKKIEFAYSEEPDAKRKITVSGGVSENPLDGIDADSLNKAAKELLSHAKKQGKNTVVGFKGPAVCQ